MGSNESRDLTSNENIFFGLISFVIVTKLIFVFWRSLSLLKKGLQSELESANKEGDCVRQRLRFQDAQLEKVKERQDLSAEEDTRKYGES